MDVIWPLLAALHWAVPCAVFVALHAAAESDAHDALSARRLRRLLGVCGAVAWASWAAAALGDVWLWSSFGRFTRWHNAALIGIGAALLVLQMRLMQRPR